MQFATALFCDVATSYHLAVKTGDYVSAGTDANVFVTLFGEHGDTGQYHLKQSENTGNKFERGRVDKFTIETTDVGKLERLHIGHDGSGPGAGWYLEEVIVDVPSRGERFIFLCNRWLAKSEDDGRIALDLYPQADMVLCDKSKFSYFDVQQLYHKIGLIKEAEPSGFVQTLVLYNNVIHVGLCKFKSH